MDIRFQRVMALDYLSSIYLNRPGYLQVCSNLSWVGRFFRTTEDGLVDAVNFAAQLDERGAKGVYHRVTTLRDIPGNGERGGAADTLWMPGPWGDLDYGDEGHKKGSSLPPTADAALKALADSGVPEPTLLVHSGGGLYPLHLLGDGVLVDSPDTLDRLALFSVQVQNAYLHGHLLNGWSYGTGVSDLARVIRLVGSVNRKTSNARPCVVIGGTGQAVSMDDFPRPEAGELQRLANELAKRDRTAVPHRPLPEKREFTPTGDGGGVLDVLAGLDWADILVPAGWDHVGADTGGELWMRPGGDSSSKYSARILHAEPNVLVVHSESTELPPGAGQRLTKARVYSYLAGYGGDMSATARALIAGENPLGLPAQVFDAVAAVMAERDRRSWERLGVTTVSVPVAEPEDGRATEEEVDHFLRTYTRYSNPGRLARRITWAKTDPAHRQPVHFRHLVNDALSGQYPAGHALRVIGDVHRHHGGTADPRLLLSLALGAALNAKLTA